MDISNLNTTELRDLLANVSKQIKHKEAEELDAARKQILEIAANAGIAVKDIFSGSVKPLKEKSKVAIRYRDPSNAANTWTGRGRTPTWIKTLIEGGANLDQFKID